MDRIEDCISFVTGKAAQQVTRRARELLAPFGVTPVQYAVLEVLTETDGMSGAEIGARMVLDSASITGVVDRLEALDLVQRQTAPGDRRANKIVATEKALTRQASLDEAMDRLNTWATAILGDEHDEIFQRIRKLGDETEWKRHV